MKYPCTPRESALGRMARRERRAYPLARPPAYERALSPPPPRWSGASEQRRQTHQSASARPPTNPPLFPSASSARRVGSAFFVWPALLVGHRPAAGMLPPRALARPKIGATRGAWVFQQTPRCPSGVDLFAPDPGSGYLEESYSALQSRFILRSFCGLYLPPGSTRVVVADDEGVVTVLPALLISGLVHSANGSSKGAPDA